MKKYKLAFIDATLCDNFEFRRDVDEQLSGRDMERIADEIAEGYGGGAVVEIDMDDGSWFEYSVAVPIEAEDLEEAKRKVEKYVDEAVRDIDIYSLVDTDTGEVVYTEEERDI